MSKLKILPFVLLLAAPLDAAILRYTVRALDSSADPSARIPQLVIADTAAECPSSDVGDGDVCYGKDTDTHLLRANGAWVTVSTTGHTHTLAGDVDGDIATNDLDEAAVEAELESVLDLADLQGILTVAKGGAGAAPSVDDQVLVSDSAVAATWRTLVDCNDVTGKLDYNATTNTWSCVSDAGGGGGGDNIRVEDGDNAGTFTAMVDADVDDSGDINFTRAAGPPDVLTATVRADAVALSTDTTGTYVGDVAAGTGIAITGTPAENYTETVAFDFSDAGADPTLLAGECRFSNEGISAAGWVCEGETADLIETRFRVTDPATADRIVTIPNADSTTVQPDAGAANNFLTAVSSSGVISKAQPAFTNLSGAAADAQVDGSLEADEVNPTLGTQTQGNYVAEVQAGLGLTESGSPAEPATSTVSIDHAQTLAGNPALNADECIHVATATGGGLLCEGGAADTDEMLFLVPDLSEVDTTHRLVTDIATQTLTNKILAGGTVTSLVLGVITDSPSASVNDYSPTGWNGAQPSQAVVIRLTPTDTIQLTGLAGGSSGRVAVLVNALDDTAATAELVIIPHQSVASTAANRFITSDRMPIFLSPGDTATFVYDATDSRWRLTNYHSNQPLGLGTGVFSGVGDYFITQAGIISGTGASCQASTYLYGTSAQAPMMGAIQCDTGTTATGRGYLGSAGNDVVPGKGSALFIARLAVEALSTAAEEFQIWCGLHDGALSTSPTDGLYWEYARTASVNWRFCTEDAGVQQCSSTALAVDTNYIWLGFFTSGDWSDTKFFHSTDGATWTIDGAPASQNPPEAADLVSVQCGINKTVGTTQRNMDLDWWYFRYDYVRGT